MNISEQQGKGTYLSVPCRLSVLLARDAPIGVIFRRGPSKWVQLIRWRVDEDVFELGQWFHGRIYTEDSDLSPDGRHLLYLARKETRRQLASDMGTTWRAISRPPYLTALTLWQEIGTQGTDGVFENDSTVILRRESPSPHPPFTLPPQMRVKLASEVQNKLRFSLIPSAWSRWERGRFEPYEKSIYSFGKFTFWGRYARWRGDAAKRFVITRTVKRALPVESLTLTDYAALTETHFPNGTTWADFDHRNRLAWTQNGCLYVMSLPESPNAGFSFANGTPLADFNALKPKPVETPDYAKEW